MGAKSCTADVTVHADHEARSLQWDNGNADKATSCEERKSVTQKMRNF